MANEKIDKISDDIMDIKISVAEINQTLFSQHESLERHMARSAAVESQVEILKEHVYKAHGAKEFIIFSVKLLAGLSGLVALITFIMKIKNVL
jgi:hypothetical protein